MTNNSNTKSSGIGFLGLLTIVLITLKLTHFINWSWWFVLMPIWIPSLIAVIIVALIIILCKKY